MTNNIDCLEDHNIVHVLSFESRPRDLAIFLTSALLLSHGIRRDAVAILKLRSEWLCVPGSTVRHLRPDFDSAVGWIRAIIRSKKDRFLGSFRLNTFPVDMKRYVKVNVLCKSARFRLFLEHKLFEEINENKKIFFIYKNEIDSIDKDSYLIELLNIDCLYAPILLNIEIDRIRNGKKSLIINNY